MSWLKDILSDRHGNLSSTRIAVLLTLILINGVWLFVVLKTMKWITPPAFESGAILGAKALQTWGEK